MLEKHFLILLIMFAFVGKLAYEHAGLGVCLPFALLWLQVLIGLLWVTHIMDGCLYFMVSRT